MWACPGEEKRQGLLSVSVTEPEVKAQSFPPYIPTGLIPDSPGKYEHSCFAALQLPLVLPRGVYHIWHELLYICV